jgi:hypothetical protein
MAPLLGLLLAACGPPASPARPPPRAAGERKPPASQPTARLSLFRAPPCTVKDLPAGAAEALDRIKVGARSFYQADHYDTQGNLMPKRFPPYARGLPSGSAALAAEQDTGWTPRSSCCGQPERVCHADWRRNGTWAALHFQPAGPLRCQLRFVSQGLNRAANYRLEVRLEPGCRGAVCVFRLLGQVDDEFGVQTRGPELVPEKSAR